MINEKMSVIEAVTVQSTVVVEKMAKNDESTHLLFRLQASVSPIVDAQRSLKGAAPCGISPAAAPTKQTDKAEEEKPEEKKDEKSKEKSDKSSSEDENLQGLKRPAASADGFRKRLKRLDAEK